MPFHRLGEDSASGKPPIVIVSSDGQQFKACIAGKGTLGQAAALWDIGWSAKNLSSAASWPRQACPSLILTFSMEFAEH
jgi:hypothetical protein